MNYLLNVRFRSIGPQTPYIYTLLCYLIRHSPGDFGYQR